MAREQKPVTSHELVALLNRLAAKGKPLVVRIPMLGIELFRYDARAGSVTSRIKRSDYLHARKKAAAAPFLESEVPKWKDIEHLLRASGVVTYSNQDEIEAVLRAFNAEGADPAQPKMRFLAFDTNVLYQRFATRHVDRILDGPKALRWVVSKGTRAELDAQAKAKYSPEEVALMAAWGPAFARQLVGLKGLRNRRAHNGLGEYEALVRRRAAEAPCDDTTADKEENDRCIARSYAGFEQEHRATLQMLTGDGGMTTHADAQEIKSLLLQYGGAEIPTGPVDERAVLHFLHDLAVEFIAVEFEGTSIQIWGDWSGKRLSHWSHERLMFTYAKDDKLAAEVVQDLHVCELVRNAEHTLGQVSLYDARADYYAQPVAAVDVVE